MVGREEVFESTAQFPLFRYSIPMLPEAAQFGGAPACQWFSGLELFLPRIRRAELGGCHIAVFLMCFLAGLISLTAMATPPLTASIAPAMIKPPLKSPVALRTTPIT